MQEAQRSAFDPGGAPTKTPIVLEAIFSEVLQWGHSSRLAWHPSLTQMLHLIRQWFWWPSLIWDTRTFITACPICACEKSSHQPSAGLLQPLSIPRTPLVQFCPGLCNGTSAVGGERFPMIPSGHLLPQNPQWHRIWPGAGAPGINEGTSAVPHLLGQACHHPPMTHTRHRSSTGRRYTRSGRYWTFTTGAAVGSTCWTGRGTAQRSGCGFPAETVLFFLLPLNILQLKLCVYFGTVLPFSKTVWPCNGLTMSWFFPPITWLCTAKQCVGMCMK